MSMQPQLRVAFPRRSVWRWRQPAA